MTAGAGGAAPRRTYVRIGTLTANFQRADRSQGVLSVELGLDLPDAALMDHATRSTPRIRAAGSGAVRTIAAGLRGHTPPDVERLGRELQTAVDQAMGRAGARVLLGTVMAI